MGPGPLQPTMKPSINAQSKIRQVAIVIARTHMHGKRN
jgi:hypothetical protein